jgi:prepilin-type N-terminal cleavage/methylation domain-containing protein
MSPLISHSHKLQSGFTLLELVLVLFIIALVASTPLLFIDEQDQQVRFDETLQKMDLIRDAILKRESYRGQPVLSGFIVDNGVLPGSSATEELLTTPTDWLALTQTTPYFNFGSDSSDAVAVTQLTQRKGHAGRYVFGGVDSNNELRDGWGQPFITDSSGASGMGAGFKLTASGAVAAYSGRTPGILIDDSDWQVPLTAVNIQLFNFDTSTAIPVSDDQQLAILVFRNSTQGSDPASLWTSYHFAVDVSQAPATGIPAVQTSPTLISGWQRNAEAADNTDYLPVGEHPVLLINDDNGDPQAEDIYQISKLLVTPNGTQPTLTLTVSP